MKKHEAEEKLERAGARINDLNASAWNTALHPTNYGWMRSIASVVTIPVLSAASIGHLVTSAVVKQIEPDTFEKMTNLGGKKPEK